MELVDQVQPLTLQVLVVLVLVLQALVLQMVNVQLVNNIFLVVVLVDNLLQLH